VHCMQHSDAVLWQACHQHCLGFDLLVCAGAGGAQKHSLHDALCKAPLYSKLLSTWMLLCLKSGGCGVRMMLVCMAGKDSSRTSASMGGVECTIGTM
jgi:hypothetical protein